MVASCCLLDLLSAFCHLNQLPPTALSQRLVLVENNDDLPIMKQRQRTAFPPNYIHSIDSSHMMLTAIACRAEGACAGGWCWMGGGVEDRLPAGASSAEGGHGARGEGHARSVCRLPDLKHPPTHHPPEQQAWTLRGCTTPSGRTRALWSA